MTKIQNVAALLILAAGCASCGESTGGFEPSPHGIGAIAQKQVLSSPKERYRSYDREAILKRAGADDRFTAAIERVRKAEEPLASMRAEELRALIPSADTKRALMVHRKGCPVHAGCDAVYRPFGIIVDLSHPLRAGCSIGGEYYPNADFPDDGQGWLDDRPGSPTEGERYYFTGWFNHWFLFSLGEHIKQLAQLWFLTGEERYFRTARVLLDRFAEVYPDLDGQDLTYDGTDWG